MARVTITREELEDGLLPPVCALTGAPTDDVKKKTFMWQPGWVSVLILAGLLPYLIVSLMMRKQMRVELPMVRDRHGHWIWRVLVGLSGVTIGFSAIIGGGLLAENRGSESVGGVLALVGVSVVLVSLIVWLVLNNNSIRPAEITDRDITLVGVHQGFVDALENDRDADEERYERERGRNRSRRRDEFDDEGDRPRKAGRYDDQD